jgi:cytochrome P450
VIAGMLGLPREDYKQFQLWSIAILSVFTKREAAIAASAEVKAYLARILDNRRREPRDDLISDLAKAELDGEQLSDEEIFSFLRLLLPAGVETTNRDESRWDDPDTFDIFRSARPSVAWGQGPHICLGMHLARVEMRLAVNLLLDRLPNLRLDPGGDDPHIRGQVFRSPTSLPVLFG